LKGTEMGARLYESTGTPVHAMSPLCKLMWMKDHLPEVFAKAHRFISIKEFIFYRFFNRFIVDRSVASSTGLLDIHTLGWNEAALEAAGINAARLSDLVPTTEIVSGINSGYASQLGIPPDTPFVIGGSDGCMAHIGSNAMRAGEVSLTVGTSGAVRMISERPVCDRRQRIFTYLITDDTYLCGGPVNNGGNVMQWFASGFLNRKVVTGAELNKVVEEATAIRAGSEGLIFLPYIHGERAPVWDADARGIFYGVSSVHHLGHFMRATMEGVCFALRSILDSVEETVGTAQNIYASGGFIRSRAWVQMLADVLGKKIEVMHAEDSSAAGAAILGMKSLGLISGWKDAAGFFSAGETFVPNGQVHDVYIRNFEVYSKLYGKFRELNQ